MEHVKAVRFFIARDHITHRVIAHVTHMDAPAGIRKHFECVEGVVGIIGRGEDIGFFPHGLPAGFGLGGIIAITHLVALAGRAREKSLDVGAFGFGEDFPVGEDVE